MERSKMAREGSFPREKSRRLDRVLIRWPGAKSQSIKIIGNGPTNMPGVFPSDHFGLVADVNIPPRPLSGSPPKTEDDSRLGGELPDLPRTADSAASPSAAPPSVPIEATVFVRVGDALIPIACVRDREFLSGTECTEGNNAIEAWFAGESTPVAAHRQRLHMELSDQDVVGYRMAGGAKGNRIPVGARVLGFAVSDPQASLRLSAVTPGGKAAEPNVSALSAASPGSRATQEVYAAVNALMAKAGLGAAAFAELREYVVASAHGESQKMYTTLADGWSKPCSEDPDGSACQHVAAVELPEHVWFLLAQHEGRVRPVRVLRDYDFELGEGGALLGVVDLNGDGVDELLTMWKYSEGSYFELLRRDGPTSFRRVGAFGDGS